MKQYPFIGDDIQKYQAELNRYIELQREARNPLKGQALTGMPHNSGVSDQTSEQVQKIIDRYQAEINNLIAKINDLLDLKKWLDKAFASLTDDERRIVYLKYNKFTTVNKIAYIMRRSRPNIYKMLDEAKEKIRRIVC